VLISSIIPFAPISWWAMAKQEQQVLLDQHEHFEKMSFRNRYSLASAQGKLQLSIPLKEGRNQRVPMHLVRIDNSVNWQLNHWKTIVSLYNRSPFFSYFEYKFEPLFQEKFDQLIDWSIASMNCVKSILNLESELMLSQTYSPQYPDSIDIRKTYHPKKNNFSIKHYPQVFEAKVAFIPDCSILDALFCTGKYALDYAPDLFANNN
jgi:hypothetical protein